MKRIKWLALIVLGMICAACNPSETEQSMKLYQQELAQTRPENVLSRDFTDSEKERLIAEFIEFYREYAAVPINRYFDQLYAEETYFRDPYRGVKGREAAKAYFLSGAEAVKSCTFEVQDAVEKNGEFYYRWVMRLRLNRSAEKLIETVGMSHVRYDMEGKIIFHQDYWDSNAVFETFPVIGSVIRWIKSRI